MFILTFYVFFQEYLEDTLFIVELLMATILIDNTCIVTTCQVLTFSKKKETNKIWLFYRASLDGARQALSTTSVLVTNHVSLTESTEIGVSIVGYRNASSLECPGMVSETTTYE